MLQREVELILKEISSITRKHTLIQQKTGGYFNVFEITNIATAEVAICRVLHDLLNPKGSHFQGDLFLKLFTEHVLRQKWSDEELANAKVYREFVITGNRRIDLVLQTTSSLIPIEVKIYAGDQERQCDDYFEVAINSNVYYLTRFGDMPLDISTLNEKNITPISFEQDILYWLTKCLEQKETMKIAPIREVILQLMAAIRNFTNQLEDEQEMEITKIISSSSDNMKSAAMIEQTITLSKINMMTKLFQAIEERIPREKYIFEDDYAIDNGKLVKQYYEKKKSTLPSINYLYRENVKPGIDLGFSIVIDWRLYAEFNMIENEELMTESLTKTDLKSLLPHLEGHGTDESWESWEYLPVNNKNQTPNFMSPDFDDDYYKLYDDEYFNQFVEECIERIDELFLSLDSRVIEKV